MIILGDYIVIIKVIKRNEKANKEMLIALMCKILRVIYGMLKYNIEFDLNEMLKNYDFRNINKEKFIDEFLGNSEKDKK